jgi:hypothetical protein
MISTALVYGGIMNKQIVSFIVKLFESLCAKLHEGMGITSSYAGMGCNESMTYERKFLKVEYLYDEYEEDAVLELFPYNIFDSVLKIIARVECNVLDTKGIELEVFNKRILSLSYTTAD